MALLPIPVVYHWLPLDHYPLHAVAIPILDPVYQYILEPMCPNYWDYPTMLNFVKGLYKVHINHVYCPAFIKFLNYLLK